ncbi:NUDIX hydrolase, partial [Streptomyces zhihengii]|uniref:NUDIX hydrolase n=1 Tax=Streptomyces zhihengii TaxID=1818004 RepID=UPI0034524D27
MPPTRTAISSTVKAYLSRHPDERDALAAVLAALDQPADVTARSTLPGHVTCSAVVIDRQGRVLHVRHRATGLLLVPGGHVDPGDRTLLAAALREASEEAGIAPGSLCLTPQMLGSPIDIDVHDIDADPANGEPAHRHYDFRYVFCLAGEERPTIVLQDEEVSGARWLTVPDVTSPTLRAKLLRTKPDGHPEPVNASVLIHDGSGRYLLHLRDHKPGVIWQSGAFDLLGGGRAHHDRSLEDTLLRELSEEVPDLRLEDLEPYAVEQATGIDGLSVPIQVFTGRWQGNPDRLRLHEGVLLHWFTPDELDRLRMSPATHALVRRHATGPTTEARPTAAPPSRDGSSRTPFLRDRSRVVHGLGERLRGGGELVVITPVAETTPEERRGIALDEDEIRVLCEGWETAERLDADGLAFLVLRGPRHPATPAVERLPATGRTLTGAIPGPPPVASCPIAADRPPAPGQPDEAVRPGEATARTVIDDGRAPSAPAAGNGRYSDHHREEPVS